MTKELDKLMDMRAKDYTNEDIDNIVRSIRKQLAMWDSGIKPKREVESDDKVQAIIANLITKTTAPAKKLKRRM